MRLRDYLRKSNTANDRVADGLRNEREQVSSRILRQTNSSIILTVKH